MKVKQYRERRSDKDKGIQGFGIIQNDLDVITLMTLNRPGLCSLDYVIQVDPKLMLYGALWNWGSLNVDVQRPRFRR